VPDDEYLEKIVANLIQKIEQRFYGKYRGIVVDNADPEQLGRLTVRVPSVLGENVVTGWATPCVPYGGDVNQGFLFIPEVKSGVWVEFEEGNLEFPIWTGTYWSKPDGKSELPKPNAADGTEEGNVQNPPTRKIIKTKKGHTIQLEDADGKEMVLIIEAKNKHVVTLDTNGIKVTDGKNKHEVTLDTNGIKITDGKNGHVVTLDANGIKIADGKNKHEVTLDGNGIKIIDSKENSIEMRKDAFNIVSKVPFKVDASGQSITLIGKTIDLNKG